MKYQTNFDKVREFHTTFESAVDEDPFDNPELVELRIDLISEEYLEVMDELDNFLVYEDVKPSKQRLAKELADLLYVVYGTATTFGIPLDLVFHEVHKSNMSKLDENGEPIFREDGKVLKSKNYHEAQLDKLFPREGK